AKGDYSKKTLIINAPNSDVNNYGLFKEIIIKAIKDNTWIEYANGNIIYLNDDVTGFVVDKDAVIKRIVIDNPNSQLNIEVKGIVEEIIVLRPSTLNITGSGRQIPVTIQETAGGSKIITKVPLALELNAQTDITLNEGAEDTSLNKSESKVVVRINNNTKKYTIITSKNGGIDVIGVGSTLVSDGNSNVSVPHSVTKKAPVKVASISINGETDVKVELGTVENDAIEKLAKTATIIDSKGGSYIVTLIWTIAKYDGNKPGDYLATGTFELPKGVAQAIQRLEQ
ncbi:MAG TPA: hypothetical protein GXZ90_06875, partial [Clostridiales bacterium]|nr:hypothetical protein [Clostridiales bacterium]